MKIWVVSLKDYNNGISAGGWIDIENKDADEIEEIIENFLEKRSKETGELHEEWAIHSYDGDLASAAGSSENPSFESLAILMEGYLEHKDAWLAYCECTDSADRSLENFRDAFIGSGESKRVWAEEYLTEAGQVDPDSFMGRYFDYEEWINDQDSGGWHFEKVNGTVYVFQP